MQLQANSLISGILIYIIYYAHGAKFTSRVREYSPPILKVCFVEKL